HDAKAGVGTLKPPPPRLAATSAFARGATPPPPPRRIRLLLLVIIEHPSDPKPIQTGTPIRSPEHILRRHDIRATGRQSLKNAVGFFFAVRFETDRRVVADLQLVAGRLQHVRSLDHRASEDGKRDVHYGIFLFVRKCRHPRL